MRIVFDLDDTLCHTENRDYSNSCAISSVVEKIKEIKHKISDAEIVIYTARGMASCNGDVEMAKKKNLPYIEAFLQRNDLKVDEIIFGKPLADIYVDDKAMSAIDFSLAGVRTYEGLSGATVCRVGNVVIKQAGNVKEQYDWYCRAKTHYENKNGMFYTPIVYSVTLGKLYMQYVDGHLAAKCVNADMIRNIIKELKREQGHIDGRNDVVSYANYVSQRAESVGVRTDIFERITNCKTLEDKTFSHGDLSLLNIISTDKGLALIDPSPNKGVESWIIDAAKIRASLNWLDEALVGIEHDRGLIDVFDNLFEDKEVLNAVKLCEESHLFRVWHYAKKLGKVDIERKLEHCYSLLYAK